jgi:NAD(P)-dependent dehydrogenase (short-subunit alcohol dehydrogenase family)
MLTGKVALVTGAGPNIGGQIARTLAEAGARVACNDVDAGHVEKVAAGLNESGWSAIAVPADITDEQQATNAVDRVVQEFGRIDIVVNNAAITVPHGLLETTTEEWQRVLSINMTGTFFVSRAAARRMVDQGEGGSIVNIASTSGHRGRAGALAYCASKGGVLNMTRAMAMDLAPHGIRVNSVSPTKTGVSVGQLESAGERFYAEIPLGRLGEPVDQARAVLFLASDQSQFCTGIDLRVDGGALASWGLQPSAIESLGIG